MENHQRSFAAGLSASIKGLCLSETASKGDVASPYVVAAGASVAG